MGGGASDLSMYLMSQAGSHLEGLVLPSAPGGSYSSTFSILAKLELAWVPLPAGNYTSSSSAEYPKLLRCFKKKKILRLPSTS